MQFWQGFPRFHIAFVIKMLFYIEIKVFWKEKKNGTRGAEDQNGLLPIFGSLSQQRIMVSYRDSECCVTIMSIVS